MRIELPPATWADATHRAEDDAHTLTVAAQPATEWALSLGEAAADPRQRVEVSAARPASLTLTF
jgi:hypothetical protein